MKGVRYFRNIFFALAAFLWLPASAHCQLETVTGLEFLRCVADGQNAKGDCNNCGCCSVEKSQYKSEQHGQSLQLSSFLLIEFTPVLVTASRLPAEVSVGILTAAPPELVQTRHFSSRAALPVRAPSFAS